MKYPSKTDYIKCEIHFTFLYTDILVPFNEVHKTDPGSQLLGFIWCNTLKTNLYGAFLFRCVWMHKYTEEIWPIGPMLILPNITRVVNVVFQEILAFAKLQYMVSCKRIIVQKKMQYLLTYRCKWYVTHLYLENGTFILISSTCYN